MRKETPKWVKEVPIIGVIHNEEGKLWKILHELIDLG